MAYEVKYRLSFRTKLNKLVRLDILENDFAGDITLLQGTDFPIELNYSNGEFDKIVGIRESKARITFYSKGVTIEDFLSDDDTQYKVEIYKDSYINPLWVGWLDSSNINTRISDRTEPITLMASDGLPLLKNTDLSDLDDEQCWGNYRIKDLITFCLDKTKLGLNYHSHIDIYPEGEDQRDVNAAFDAFWYARLSSFTFITGPRSFDDCYTVLSKILDAFRCSMYQANGVWCIVHEDEKYFRDAITATSRDANLSTIGEVASFGDVTLQPREIGLTKKLKFINFDAVKSWQRPFKHVAFNYAFRTPDVLFRNWDILDGSFLAPPSSSSRVVYDVAHWENTKYPGTLADNGYIGEEIDTVKKMVTQRYLFFSTNTNPYTETWGLKTSEYYVNKDDALEFSYDTNEKNTGFASSSQFVYVTLRIDNTNYYTLDIDGNWYYNVRRRVGYDWRGIEDRRNWKTYSITTNGFPENGFLSIEFTSSGHSQSASNEVRFKNFSASLIYAYAQKYRAKGQQNKCESGKNVKDIHEQEMFISDALNTAIQGSIIDVDYQPVSLWKRAQDLDADSVPFGKHITRVMHRLTRRNFIKIEGTIFGVEDPENTDNFLTLLNDFKIEGIPDVIFMPTTMVMDLKNERCEVTMIEIVNPEVDTDDLTGTERFTYIEETQEYFDKLKEDKKPIDWRFGIIGWGVQLITRSRRRKFNGYN